MSPKDVRKTALITKSNFFDWNDMPFGMKNVTSMFSKIMTKVFEEYMDKFLKVFVDDVNIHNMTWEDHL